MNANRGSCPNCGWMDCAADAAYWATKDSKHGRMAECKSEVARYWMARALKAEAKQVKVKEKDER